MEKENYDIEKNKFLTEKINKLLQEKKIQKKNIKKYQN